MGVSKVVYGNETLIDLTADTVIASKLASGFTAHGADGELITGTNTYDADTSDATATAATILDGETAYAGGSKITGTMPNRGGATGTISDKTVPYSIPAGYHDGSGTVAIDTTEAAKIIAANIKSGVSILGVEGNYSGEAISAQAKSVTPAVAAQTVLPDEGYDYLSQVNVAAIPYTETPNAAGGVTVTIAGA